MTSEATQTFRTTVRASGKTATGLPVPPDVIGQLGAGKRPAITVTLNRYTYRSTVGVVGGEFMIPLSAEHRTAAGVSSGEEVEVTVALDTQPRDIDIPDDLTQALARDNVLEKFGRLSPSAKKRYLLSVESAKTQETRDRRIAAAVTDLSSTP
jgi:hypothetical protein